MIKRTIRSAGILFGLLLALSVATGAMAKDVVEYNPSYGKVTFTHKDHAEKLKIDCVRCHHTWKKGETSGKLCKECHKAKAEGKTISAKDAYHKDCKGCHDEAKKAKKAAGPTTCTKCHVKAKK